MTTESQKPLAHSILFSGAMVRALLDGSKTQTRRVIKPLSKRHPIVNLREDGFDTHDLYSGAHNDPKSWGFAGAEDGCDMALERWPDLNPYGMPAHLDPYKLHGSMVWVRETWMKAHNFATHTSPRHCLYAADGECIQKWTPSIHMPRWASRITLEITAVRAERLQDISTADAIAEGIERTGTDMFRSYLSGGHIVAPRKDAAAIASYFTLWESINGAESLAANPWVWVIEFKVHQCNVDALLGKQAA